MKNKASNPTVEKNKILGLIFSKNRAMQLDATLSSFLLHARDSYLARLVVIYDATSATHESQYALLQRQYGDLAGFVRETDFRRQLLDILKTAHSGVAPRSRLPLSNGERNPARLDAQEYLLFLVDDAIFVRDFSLNSAVNALASQPQAIGFSMRLGRNTTHCYSLSRTQSSPDFRVLEDEAVAFNWTRADGDFAYPLEISSSMYSLSMILQLGNGLKFRNPNTLESALAAQARRLARQYPTLLCYERSVAFCAPVNRVQDVYKNRSGEAADLSVAKLSALFELGQRVNVRGLAGFVPSACHQEVVLTFEERVPSLGQETSK